MALPWSKRKLEEDELEKWLEGFKSHSKTFSSQQAIDAFKRDYPDADIAPLQSKLTSRPFTPFGDIAKEPEKPELTPWQKAGAEMEGMRQQHVAPFAPGAERPSITADIAGEQYRKKQGVFSGKKFDIPPDWFKTTEPYTLWLPDNTVIKAKDKAEFSELVTRIEQEGVHPSHTDVRLQRTFTIERAREFQAMGRDDLDVRPLALSWLLIR